MHRLVWGLAPIWQYPERPAVVVMPQGAHPSVDNFMALHSILFPIRPMTTVGDNVHKVRRLCALRGAWGS